MGFISPYHPVVPLR